MARLPVFALAQFGMSLSWVAYAIFLPGLAAQVGLDKSAVVWLLLIDQVVFMVADLLVGTLADRMEAALLQWGRALGMLTGAAALALLAVPVLAGVAASPLALVLPALVWIACSAALRAPLFALVGKRARASTGEDFRWLLLGNGVALAAAPYLATTLKGTAPLVTFAAIASGLVLCAMLVTRAVAQDADAPSSAASTASSAAVLPSLPQVPVFFMALLIAALGAQVHTALNMGALYGRSVPAAELHWWMPAFWAGFNLAMVLPAPLATWPPARRLAAFAIAAALALLACADLTAPFVQAALQVLAGAAWACFLCAAFATANALGGDARRGRMAGGVHATLAGASVLRLSMAAAAVPQAWGSALFWLPVLLCGVAAAVMWLMGPRRTAP